MEDDDDARPAAPEQRPHEALGGPARDDVGHRRAASAATRRTGRPGDPRPRRPVAWSRSCAWSRRMNDSSGRGSSSSARSSGTGGQYGPAVPSALSRLIRGGAAYQSPALVSGLLALVTLPLYTRNLSPADLGVAETVLTFIILGSIVLRGGLAEALVRLWFTEDDAEARARMARTALGTVAVVTTLVALAGAAVRGAARRRAVQPARRGHRPPRDPRALELHEPRDGVRAAARGGAPEGVRPGVDGERAAHRGAHGDAGRRPRRGRRTGTWPATTSPAPSCCVGIWATEARRLGRARRPLPAQPDAALRAADRAGGGRGLRAQRHRPRVPAALGVGGRRRPVRPGGEARDRGDRRGAGVRPRVAAAGVLGHRRRRGAAALRHGHDVVRRDHRPRRADAGPRCRAGSSTSSRRRTSPPRTRRSAGSRSAGASTGSRSCSSPSRAAPASRPAARRPRSAGSPRTSSPCSCSSRRWASPARGSRSASPTSSRSRSCTC